MPGTDWMGGMDPVTLYSRPGCHLCEEARRELDRNLPGSRIVEVDVDSDGELRRRYGWDIPVAVWKGQTLFRHRFDPRCIRIIIGE